MCYVATKQLFVKPVLPVLNDLIQHFHVLNDLIQHFQRFPAPFVTAQYYHSSLAGLTVK